MSNIEEYTKNFKFMIPDFNVATWHTEIKENFKAIDALIANFVQSQQYQGAWKQVTSYTINDLVYISDEDSDYYGYLMRVKVNHTTTGDDFDTYLANNPTYYEVQGEMGAQIAALRAQDWAEKTDGKVIINNVPVDYSSKAYAIGGTGTETNNAKYFKEQAELARDTILEDPGFIAIKADFLGDETIKTVAEKIDYVQSVGTNIQSVVDVSTNIADVNTLASNIAAILTNSANISSINTNATNISNINNVSSNMSEVNNCSTNMSAILDAPNQASSAAQSAQTAIQAALSVTNGWNLLDYKPTDHLLNDQNWLRADTFSWHNKSQYEEVYNHLVNDYNNALSIPFIIVRDIANKYIRNPKEDALNSNSYKYCWVNESDNSDIRYTNTETPTTSDYCTQTPSGQYTRRIDDVGTLAPRTEIVGSYTVTYYQAQDGHKIVLPDQEETVQNIFNESGMAWYYILDITNQKFKLPRKNYHGEIIEKLFKNTEDGYIWANVYDDGWCEQGGYIEPTNANSYINLLREYINVNYIITTSCSYTSDGNIYTPCVAATSRLRYRFSIHVPNTSYHPYWKTCGWVHINKQTSLNNAYKYLYFYVGQYTQTATEQTAGLNTELFNGKLDIDLGNVSNVTKETITGWDMPDYSAGISVSTEYIAPSNGYLTITIFSDPNSTSSQGRAYIDGNLVAENRHTSGGLGLGLYETFFVKIKKGSELTYEEKVSAIFYPAIGG